MGVCGFYVSWYLGYILFLMYVLWLFFYLVIICLLIVEIYSYYLIFVFRDIDL